MGQNQIFQHIFIEFEKQQQDINRQKINFFIGREIMPKSRIKFRNQEIKILQQIAAKYKQQQKIQANKITQEFNEKCQKIFSNFTKKSIKAIQIKLTQILNIQRHYWSSDVNQLMMSSIIQGKQWKQISQLKQFAHYKLEAKQIKRKFQCGMRNKFKCLYRKVYNQQAPHISDTVYKLLIQQEKIQELYQSRVLTLCEKQTLTKNINFFKENIGQQDYSIRSSQAKRKLLNRIHPQTYLNNLVDSVVKLNNYKLNKTPQSVSVNQLLNENQLTRTFSTLVNLQLPICPHYQQTHSQLFFSDQLNSQINKSKFSFESLSQINYEQQQYNDQEVVNITDNIQGLYDKQSL